jgi:hypothetical protein
VPHFILSSALLYLFPFLMFLRLITYTIKWDSGTGYPGEEGLGELARAARQKWLL